MVLTTKIWVSMDGFEGRSRLPGFLTLNMAVSCGFALHSILGKMCIFQHTRRERPHLNKL
jgi:hypothetical protein